MKVLHIPCYYKRDVVPVLEKNHRLLDDYRKIGVVSTAQHLNQLDAVRKFLKSRGKQVWVGGQVLGCRQASATAIESKVDVFLYVGSGLFHPLGLLAKTKKPVVVLNPYAGTMAELPAVERERWLKRQRGRIAKALSADSYGVLVSTKDGQFNLKGAFSIMERLRSHGKRVFLFAGDELTPENLMPFKVDCWVNTACPRLAEDEYNRPVVNAEELEDFIK